MISEQESNRSGNTEDHDGEREDEKKDEEEGGNGELVADEEDGGTEREGEGEGGLEGGLEEGGKVLKREGEVEGAEKEGVVDVDHGSSGESGSEAEEEKEEGEREEREREDREEDGGDREEVEDGEADIETETLAAPVNVIGEQDGVTSSESASADTMGGQSNQDMDLKAKLPLEGKLPEEDALPRQPEQTTPTADRVSPPPTPEECIEKATPIDKKPSPPLTSEVTTPHNVPPSPLTSKVMTPHNVPPSPLTSEVTTPHNVPPSPLTSKVTTPHNVPPSPLTSEVTTPHNAPPSPLTSKVTTPHNVPPSPLTSKVTTPHNVPPSPLTFASYREDSIEGCLRKFCSKELLTGNNRFVCDCCTRRKANEKAAVKMECEEERVADDEGGMVSMLETMVKECDLETEDCKQTQTSNSNDSQTPRSTPEVDTVDEDTCDNNCSSLTEEHNSMDLSTTNLSTDAVLENESSRETASRRFKSR